MGEDTFELVERLKAMASNMIDKAHWERSNECYEEAEIEEQEAKALNEAAAALQALAVAVKPFISSYEKQDSAIPDSDLDNEQPKHITVQLGDLRRARSSYSLLKQTKGEGK